MNLSKNTMILIGAATIILVAGVIYYKFYKKETMEITSTSKPSETDSGNDIERLAKVLSSHGWVMYGNENCGWCKRQKEEFGEAFKYINYIDCNSNPALCKSEGATAAPFWKNSNTEETQPGYYSLEDIVKNFTLGEPTSTAV